MAQINIKFKKNEAPAMLEFIENQNNFSESVRGLILSHVKKYGTGDYFRSLLGIVEGHKEEYKEEHKVEQKNEQKNEPKNTEIDECYKD